MHLLALIAVTLAGLAFCSAALLRWRNLQKDDVDPHRWVWPVWLGILFLTVGLVFAFLDGQHPSFRFGVLVSWVAIATIFFVSRYLTLPSRGLLVLPVGGMALLVALTGLAEKFQVQEVRSDEDGMPAILIIHILFMTCHMAAMLASGAAGGTYLLTSRKLKTSVDAALRLPSLSTLERLCERALVIATALLIGGLVTGASAMRLSEHFSLTSWPAISGMVSMAALVIMLALRLAGKLTRRYLAFGSLFVLVLAVLSLASVFAGHYGN